MSKPKKSVIEVQGTAVTILSGQDDYISLTDIARYKEPDRTDHVIQNWIETAIPWNFLASENV